MGTALKKSQFINRFALKIIAMVTMTIDHIGVLLSNFLSSDNMWIYVLRCIGRLALPLFCFLVVEAVIHTKNKKLYLLKLGIMATFIAGVYLILFFNEFLTANSLSSFGNIFIDLLLGALVICLLSKKEWYLKLLALFPIAISFASFFCCSYEAVYHGIVWWYPFALRTQYGFYAVMLCVGFYFAKWVADALMSSYSMKMNVDKDVVFAIDQQNFVTNLVGLILTIAITIIYWLMSEQFPNYYLTFQPFAIFAGALLLLYNGKQGYNSKWFKYGSYLYYPLHIGILALIYVLCTL